MAAYAEQPIEMACLGRPFKLGMLYNCPNEKAVPGFTLWNQQQINNHLDTFESMSNNFHIITEDNFENKSQHFDISGELKISLLSGLFSVDGSAKYLKCNRTSRHHARVTLQYTCKTFFQQLTMAQLAKSKIQHQDVFKYGTATHVVTGVQYGVDCIFVLEREVEKHEDITVVEGFLKALVDKIPKVTGNIEGKATFNDEEKQETEKLTCTFFGDIQLDENPTTYKEAIAIYKKLPTLIKSSAKSKGQIYGVPKNVSLYPLSLLDNKAAKLQKMISADVLHDVKELLDQYSVKQLEINELICHRTCIYFPGIREQLECFKSFLTKHMANFQQFLQSSLPNIRTGTEEENVLIKHISQVKTSAFKLEKMDHWINTKKKELLCLEGHIDCLKGFTFANESGQLEQLVNIKQYVVVFYFGSITRKDHSYLKVLSNLNQMSELTEDDDNEWFENDDIVKNLQNSLMTFKAFATENCGKKELTCIISTSFSSKMSRMSDFPGSIFVYKNGSGAKFRPHSCPGVPISTSCTEHEIQLTWNKPEFGSECISHYIVRYKFDQDQDNSCTHESESTNDVLPLYVIKLKPNTAYIFQVAAVCEVGKGEFSDWSQLISTKALPSVAEEIFVSCSKIESINSHHTWYQLQKTETYADVNKRFHKFDIFKPSFITVNEKVILLIGVTGSGKTTLINGMINFILGVNENDRFRFQLVVENLNKSQAKSQTSTITAYTINWQNKLQIPFTLTIIDTPGFGDTDGIEKDIQIFDQINEFLKMPGSNAIEKLDVIGFVAPATNPRLTKTQEYIFYKIFSIFGRNIADNIFVFITFADGNPPNILAALEEYKLSYQKYFKFNNSGFNLTATSTRSKMTSAYWELSKQSFKGFFDQLNIVRPNTLKLTMADLEMRDQLTSAINGSECRKKLHSHYLETVRKHILYIEQINVYAQENVNKADWLFCFYIVVYIFLTYCIFI